MPMSKPMSKGKKKNLMLTVDENVVEKAKALGINISDVTEGILRGFVFKPTQSDRETEYQYYEELFKVMVPLLQEYSTSVKVGVEYPEPDAEHQVTYEYYLGQDGKLWVTEWDTHCAIRDAPIWVYLEPKQILSNFIDALYMAREKRKDRLKELEVVRRMVEAMTGSIKPKEPEKEGGKKP